MALRPASRFLAIACVIVSLLTSWRTQAVAQVSDRIAPYAQGLGAKAQAYRQWRLSRPRIEIILTDDDMARCIEGAGPRLGIVARGGVYRAKGNRYALANNGGGLRLVGHTAPGGTVLVSPIWQNGPVKVVALEHLHILPHPHYGARRTDSDVLQLNQVDHLFLNHLTLAFSEDETADLSYSSFVTVGWSQIGWQSDNGHAMALFMLKRPALFGTSHHNLFQGGLDRNPMLVDGMGESIEDSAVNCVIGFTQNHRDTGSQTDLYWRYKANVIGFTYIAGQANWWSSGVWRRGTVISLNRHGRYHVSDLYSDTTDNTGRRRAGFVRDVWQGMNGIEAPFYPFRTAAEGRLAQPIDWTVESKWPRDGSVAYVPVTRLTNSPPPDGEPPASHAAVLKLAGAWPRNRFSRTYARAAGQRGAGIGMGHPRKLPELDLKTGTLPTELTDYLRRQGHQIDGEYLLAEHFIQQMQEALLAGEGQQATIDKWTAIAQAAAALAADTGGGGVQP